MQAGFGLGGPMNQATVRTSTSPTSATTKTSPARSGSRPRRRRWPSTRSGSSPCAPTTTSPAPIFQVNDRNFLNVRWLLEDAASRGEGFNTNTETPDAKVWEADHDTMWAGTYTSVLTDRLSSVTRIGRIGESLTTAPEGFFNDDGKAIGFDGRDPFSIGQRNQHPSYTTGTGGGGYFTNRHPQLTSSTRPSAISSRTCSAANTR